jgi:hypothetical protein
VTLRKAEGVSGHAREVLSFKSVAQQVAPLSPASQNTPSPVCNAPLTQALALALALRCGTSVTALRWGTGRVMLGFHCVCVHLCRGGGLWVVVVPLPAPMLALLLCM